MVKTLGRIDQSINLFNEKTEEGPSDNSRLMLFQAFIHKDSILGSNYSSKSFDPNTPRFKLVLISLSMILQERFLKLQKTLKLMTPNNIENQTSQPGFGCLGDETDEVGKTAM